MTQEQLALILGVKHSIISKYENGIVSPTLEQIENIASALGVDPLSFMTFEEASDLICDDINRKDTGTKKMLVWDALESILRIAGFTISADEEGGAIFLTDHKTGIVYEPSADQLKELESNITAFSKFQIFQMISTMKPLPH